MLKSYHSRISVFGIFIILFFFQKGKAQLISHPFEILLKSERIILPENIHEINLKEEHLASEIINGKLYRFYIKK